MERGFDTNYDRNKWIHVVKVLNTATSSDLEIVKDLKGGIGLLSVHDTTPNAEQLYNNFFTTAHRVQESTVATISERTPKIYGHDWTVHSV